MRPLPLLVAVLGVLLLLVLHQPQPVVGDDRSDRSDRWRTRRFADLNLTYPSSLTKGEVSSSSSSSPSSSDQNDGSTDARAFSVITVDKSNVCTLSPMKIFLTSRSIVNAHLIVRVDGSDFVSYINVEDVLQNNLNAGGDKGHGTTFVGSNRGFKGEIGGDSCAIKCISDDLHCIPAVQDIFVDPHRNVLTLQFQTNTTEPDLSSTSQILRALTFSPPAVGSMSAVWKTPSNLELKIDNTFVSDIIQYFSSNNEVEIKVRQLGSDVNAIWNSESWLNISQRIRFSEAGLHYIFAIDAETMNLISNVVSVKVSHCNDPVISKYDSLWTRSDYLEPDIQSSDQLAIAKPILVQEGVLSITGNNALKIPQSSIPGMASGSWSLSLWIYLLESGSSEYQTLFYKGDSHSERTPSAWLLPSARRLTLRFSTDSNKDIGGETLKDIPTGQWSLLTFTFLNLTTHDNHENSTSAPPTSSSGNDKPDIAKVDITDAVGRTKTIDESFESKLSKKKEHYSRYLNYKITNRTKYLATAYLNGKLDIIIEFPMNVNGNEGPLQLFKDISHKGPTSFASGITLWNAVLSAHEVAALYAKGPPASHKLVDSAMNMLSSTLPSTDNDLASECEKHNSKTIFQNHFGSTKRDDILPLLANQPVETNEIPNSEKTTSVEVGVDSSESLFTSDYNSIDSSLIAAERFEKAKASTLSCDSYDNRLDLYAEAASLGSVAALHFWGMLVAFGFESPDNKCGIDASLKRGQKRHEDDTNDGDNDNGANGGSSDENDPSLVRSLVALTIAAELGSSASLVPLVSLVNSGLGLRAFEKMGDLSYGFTSQYYRGIPLPYYLKKFNGRRDKSFHVLLSNKIVFSYSNAYGDNDESSDESENYESDGLQDDVEIGTSSTTATSAAQQINFPLGISVLDMQTIAHVTALKLSFHVGWRPGDTTLTNVNCADSEVFSDCTSLSDILTGLLHVAAISGHADANAILSYRYQHGISVKKDVETAVFYAYLGSVVASEEFHRVGGQPVAETERINDKTEFEVEKGTKGNDDEIIQAQLIRAEEGDVPAMLASADLYYFGARGLVRDQPRALDLYTRAGNAGDLNGKCGAAAMFLKGEGTATNTTKAIELYEEASALGSMKAFNGLGYLYFYGQSAPKNESKAFYYFLAAAETETDGDSLFNAGYCLENGIGVEKDLKRAAVMYQIAARKFGHFDAIKNLGVMHMEGKGLVRNPNEALFFLTVAQGIGPWVGWNRRGLDQYLSKDYSKSLQCYVLGGEFGYEVAQSNAAFIVRRRFQGRHLSFLALRQLLLSSYHQNSVSTVSIGVMHLQDEYVPGDVSSAVWWLTRASSLGSGLASMYLGVMNNFGVGVECNLPRAKRYYEHAVNSKGNEVESQLKFVMNILIWLIDNSLNGGYIYGIVAPILGYFVKYYLLPIKPI